MWDALSAVGTLLAVIVALGLALLSEFQRRKENTKRAGLVASRLLESVILLAEEVRHKMAAFAFYDDGRDSNNDGFADEVLTLRRLTEAISLESIYALEPLPRNCASRLAMALGIIDALGREVEYSKALQPWTQRSPEWRKHYTTRWMSLSSSAADYLHMVRSELELAAGAAAPRPSAEDIHGPWHDDS